MDALTSVQVTSGKDRSGFQITFAVSKKSHAAHDLLPAGYFDPMVTRVIVIATLGGSPNVLMDGIVTRQEMQPSSEPGKSTLTITGEDLSVLMDVDRQDRSLPGDARRRQALRDSCALRPVSASARSSSRRSCRSSALPPTKWETPAEVDRPRLHQTARAALRLRLLRASPGPLPGQSIAYFGPDIRTCRFRSRRSTSTWTRTPTSSR